MSVDYPNEFVSCVVHAESMMLDSFSVSPVFGKFHCRVRFRLSNTGEHDVLIQSIYLAFGVKTDTGWEKLFKFRSYEPDQSLPIELKGGSTNEVWFSFLTEDFNTSEDRHFNEIRTYFQRHKSEMKIESLKLKMTFESEVQRSLGGL